MNNCSNCKWAEWPDNPTGNPNVRGQCTFPIPPIPSTYVLSKVVNSGVHNIRPDFGEYCMVWEAEE